MSLWGGARHIHAWSTNRMLKTGNILEVACLNIVNLELADTNVSQETYQLHKSYQELCIVRLSIIPCIDVWPFSNLFVHIVIVDQSKDLAIANFLGEAVV